MIKCTKSCLGIKSDIFSRILQTDLHFQLVVDDDGDQLILITNCLDVHKSNVGSLFRAKAYGSISRLLNDQGDAELAVVITPDPAPDPGNDPQGLSVIRKFR